MPGARRSQPLSEGRKRRQARVVPLAELSCARGWPRRYCVGPEASHSGTCMTAIVSPIGHRTARDLCWGAPPPQLVGAFLTPEGPTILYAHGGTGKGMVACW